MVVHHSEIHGLFHGWNAKTAFLWQDLRAIAVLLLATSLFTTYVLSAQTIDGAAHRIQSLIQNGDFETARKAVAEAIKAAPNNASLYNLQGVVLVWSEAHTPESPS